MILVALILDDSVDVQLKAHSGVVDVDGSNGDGAASVWDGAIGASAEGIDTDGTAWSSVVCHVEDL